MKQSSKLSKKETYYLHPRCYAHGIGSCSSKISKEHFISESLLRQIELSGTVKIAGLACQDLNKFDIFGIKHRNLAPKILCKHHNSALSYLDNTIGIFFKTIGDINRVQHPSVPQSAVLERKKFSGNDIEKWMLKCLLGMTSSSSLKRSAYLKPECLALLFGKMDWPDGWGLYFIKTNRPIYHSGSLLIQTGINQTNGLILSAEFCIRGLPFMLCMGRLDNTKSFDIIYRPKEIIFEVGVCKNVIELTWSSYHSEGIILSRVGTYDGAPPDWQEWERIG